MSYATRCTACGTIFRVVQDQLRVSEGWVRCGRCAEVFDAREQLFDIDVDTPPVWAGDAGPTPTRVLSPESNDNAATAADFEPPSMQVDREQQRPEPRPAEVTANAIAVPHARLEPQWVDASDTANEPDEPGDLQRAAEPDLASADVNQEIIHQKRPAEAAESSTVASTASAELPSFMRSPRPASRRHGPGMRLTIAGLTLLLVATFVLQFLLHFRDAIAAVYPDAAPSLQALCQVSRCTVQPWKRIEALSVENSALTQSANGRNGNNPSNQYQLTLNLHNKSGTPVATPSIELSLLNYNGVVVLRRVLGTRDFRQDRDDTVNPTAIAPAADIPMMLQVTTGSQPISGYSVEIFYP